MINAPPVLNKPVLVLNSSYEPLQVSSVKRAIALTILKKAEMIEGTGQYLHSISIHIEVPSIVRIMRYIKLPYSIYEITRNTILTRDNFECQYCGASGIPLTVDHIIPKIRGGMDTWDNLITACHVCNTKKGNRTPDEANMKLRSKPTRPNRIHQIRYKAPKYIDVWRPYLFMD